LIAKERYGDFLPMLGVAIRPPCTLRTAWQASGQIYW